jgi:hypothetical protein
LNRQHPTLLHRAFFGQDHSFSNGPVFGVHFNEQYIGLNKAYTESWKRYQQGFKGLDKNLSDQQRSQQMRDLQRDLFADISKSSSCIFTSPEQRQRFDQMFLQFRGFDAFQDPAIQKKLNLNDAQRQMLDQYGREWNTQMGNYNRTYNTDRKGTLKRFNATQKQALEQINSVLTPEQQKTWAQMTGELYTFHPSVYFQGSVKTGKIGGSK